LVIGEPGVKEGMSLKRSLRQDRGPFNIEGRRAGGEFRKGKSPVTSRFGFQREHVKDCP
jgi:hypothetical protein